MCSVQRHWEDSGIYMTCTTCVTRFSCTGTMRCARDGSAISLYDLASEPLAKGKTACLNHQWVGTGDCPRCSAPAVAPEPPKTPKLVVIPKPEINKDAATMLHDMAKRVESGEINFVLVIGVGADGTVTDGWSQCPEMRPFTVLGALEYVKMRFSRIEIET